LTIDSNQACERLHRVLEALPLISFPFQPEQLPENGIYFFYQRLELWGHGDKSPRIVRVGTHKDGNFRNRIAEHYLFNEAKMNFGIMQSAPHDRSIFRKHLGRAILNKSKDPYLAVWNIDFTARDSRVKFSHLRDLQKERSIETEVTTLLRQDFSFKFIELEGQQARMGRNGLEAALIGTLAHCRACEASADWLGHHSPKEQVRNSGLWLVQHLACPPLTDMQSAIIDDAVQVTAGKYFASE
jgi:hypothetical protein